VGGTIYTAAPPFPHFGLRKSHTRPVSAGVGVELGGALRLVGPHGCGHHRPATPPWHRGADARGLRVLGESTISHLRRLPERHESDALQIQIIQSG